MKIYFLTVGLSSFVKRDIEILSRVHQVRVENNYCRALGNLWRNLHGILWSDMVFCWFGSIHFLPSVILAKILGRKLVVVAGGYDVVCLPEINYGSMRKGWRRLLVRLLFALADRIISISESNRAEAINNAKIDPCKIVLVPHGFPLVPKGGKFAKEKLVVTIGEVTHSNLKRKGLEDFVAVAKFFPEIPFKVIGKWRDNSYEHLRQIAPVNVELTGFVEDTLLVEYLTRAKVYVQSSRHEGFGCSVAEAMLYRCIPVVNDIFALPEVVGDCGFLAVPQDMDSLKDQIQRALDSEDSSGDLARKRIIEKFSLENRARLLMEAISSE